MKSFKNSGSLSDILYFFLLFIYMCEFMDKLVKQNICTFSGLEGTLVNEIFCLLIVKLKTSSSFYMLEF